MRGRAGETEGLSLTSNTMGVTVQPEAIVCCGWCLGSVRHTLSAKFDVLVERQCQIADILYFPGSVIANTSCHRYTSFQLALIYISRT